MLSGLIIGYSSLIINGISSTHRLIETISTVVLLQFENIVNLKDVNTADILMSLHSTNDKRIVKERDFLIRSVKQLQVINHFDFFYSDKDETVWKSFHIDSDAPGKKIIKKNLETELNKSLKREIHLSSDFFYGKTDNVSIFFNLTRKNDRNNYIFYLTVNRKGIIHLIKANIKSFIIFSSLIFLISIIIGRITAVRFSKPIVDLSSSAEKIASGDYSHRLEVKRKDEIGVMADSFNIMADNIQRHITDIESKMMTMQTMNKIDKAVLSSMSRNDLLARVIGIVSSLHPEYSIVLAFNNRKKKGFEILTCNDTDINSIFREKSFFPESEFDNKIIEKTISVFQLSTSDSEEMESFFKKNRLKNSTVLNVPIFLKEKYLASMIILRGIDRKFNTHEINSFRMIADQAGVAFQSVRLVEEKESLLLGILKALTRSIDANSKWTAGHSERVAKYAELIGRKMKLNEKQLRELFISGILHDIGKISVPETILDKPGRLTDEEYGIIKKHPETGTKIIEDIPAYMPIRDGILHHHEHWNGNGYPSGLSKDEIPIYARILTIADVYDAITADRPYRKGLERKEALEFINENTGEMFDPELAKMFLEVLEEEETFTPITLQESAFS